MTQSKFSYRVVFFHQANCVACNTMKPIWEAVKSSVAEDYAYYNIGFGEWDVNSDNWEFLDLIQGDGTPNFAVFNSGDELIGLNTDGIVPESQLKTFIISAITKNEN